MRGDEALRALAWYSVSLSRPSRCSVVITRNNSATSTPRSADKPVGRRAVDAEDAVLCVDTTVHRQPPPTLTIVAGSSPGHDRVAPDVQAWTSAPAARRAGSGNWWVEVSSMRRSVMAAGIGVAAIVGWRRCARPGSGTGARPSKRSRTTLPGDALTPPPVDQCTRAITIAVPAEAVWPWLVQMGADRGGFYSYAWMENLFGLQIDNADRIHDEWQQLADGDALWGDRRRRGGWVVEHLEPNVALVLKPPTRRPARPPRVTRASASSSSGPSRCAHPLGGTRLLIRSGPHRSPADPLADGPRRARQLRHDPQDADGIRVRAESTPT